MRLSNILGLNARSQLYSYKYNSGRGKTIANSKIKTDLALTKAGIPHPEILAKFKSTEQIEKFHWDKLPEAFALKPSRGLGGEGIIIVKKKDNDGDGWITIQKQKVGVDDLKLHTMDILEGAYSMDYSPDVAFIQEFIGRHKAFRKYAYRGTPDIRIIVFNKVPVMAMLRLPTKESGGRANLHQGAVAVGVDIATGITTRAIWHNEAIIFKPGTKRKLTGIKIPEWNRMLEMAIACQEATGLGYLGADLVLHPEKGPMVLELNAEPGLSIQLANQAGLRKRLDRVDELSTRNAEHGIKIAKALFASPFSDRVRQEEIVKTVNIFETIKIKAADGSKIAVSAKLDTGAWRTSIDKDLAKNLGLLEKNNILWYKKVRSSLGVENRPVIDLVFWLAGKRVETNANIANRSRLKKKVVVGRKALKGFLVSPEIKK
jgi:alpha-L-glutamate ligase-like protein